MIEDQTLINEASPPSITPKRLKSLQKLGVLCGFAAGAWLGAAEAPTKLVSIGVSPLVISFMMVLGVFLARWSVPALLQGMSQVREDVRQAPHLMLWGILAGCLWAVANTLTIFAIRNIGLSIAFRLLNLNSQLGIIWCWLLLHELSGLRCMQWLSAMGGIAVIFCRTAHVAIA